jgi:hypothetical protein
MRYDGVVAWPIISESLTGIPIVLTQNPRCHNVHRKRIAAAKILLAGHQRCDDLAAGRIGPFFPRHGRRRGRDLFAQQPRQGTAPCAIGVPISAGHTGDLSRPVARQVRGLGESDQGAEGNDRRDDVNNVPDDLRAAHDRNDETLERIYIGRRFKNDTERLETLFQLYTEMTGRKK